MPWPCHVSFVVVSRMDLITGSLEVICPHVLDPTIAKGVNVRSGVESDPPKFGVDILRNE